MNEEGEFI